MADLGNERTKRLGHREGASVPVSTYRVQLSAAFTFADATAKLPYFAALGVGHLYLSPILQAAPGSTHFYDVVDHSRISDVLGGVEGLRRLADAASEHGLGLIADLVPNHMAVPTPAYHNGALWSVLTDGPESPYAHWFDVDWASEDPVLMPVLGERIGTVLARDELTVDTLEINGTEQAVLRYYDHVFPIRAGTESLPLAELVDQQHYRLAYWRVANEELNYRRFFDVGSLVALRVEDPDVFEATHRVIVDLINEGTLAGLRIDHPDGLADPAGYLERLRDATNGAWVVVEKILEDEEQMPRSWHAAGTTGYDAAWRVGALLRDPSGASPLAAVLHRVTGDALGTLPDIIDAAKLEIVKDSLSAELHRLATLAHAVCTADVRLRDHTFRALHDCLRAMLVAFDRYRAYVVPGVPARPRSIEAIAAAAARARAMLDPERHETLDVVVDLLKGAEVGSAGRRADAERGEIITRFQQACGAVMAKGIEDTAYYRWTHLLALCEVGSPAARFALPPASFHAWAAEQQQQYPHGMTCLTTHDTKRSEDVRTRLGVLSERAEDWERTVAELRDATADIRPPELDGRMENLWWQTAAATFNENGPMGWLRLEGYLTKAMREAKTFTTWTSVNERYEAAVLSFARGCLETGAVEAALADWRDASAPAVRQATLAMKLVQLTIPGVPDVYQGNETVAPSLVDPDNRRPVDFDAHREALERLDAGARPRTLAEEKLWVTACALRLRRDRPDAFIGPAAGYKPLAASSGHAVAFSRTVDGEDVAITLATRAGHTLDALGGWADASVTLPAGTWRDMLTDATFTGGATSIAAVLERHAGGATGSGMTDANHRWVWAPAAHDVTMVVGPTDRAVRLPLERDGDWWLGRALPANTDYSFEVDGRGPFPDPRSPRQPNGVHAASRTFDAGAFAWTDAGWAGRDARGALIYELHVGTFTAQGTLDAAAVHLGGLARLGVQMVELMPVQPFPGTHGWGYDGVAPFAVHEAYGGPEALQRFVDKAHAKGLAVCLDVVYNHLGPSGNYLGQYGPYFTDAQPHAVGLGRQPRPARQRRGAPVHPRRRASGGSRTSTLTRCALTPSTSSTTPPPPTCCASSPTPPRNCPPASAARCRSSRNPTSTTSRW